MRHLLGYIKPYWKAALIAPLLMILEVTMDLLQPRMMQRIVDQQLVLQTGLIMIDFALLGVVGVIGDTLSQGTLTVGEIIITITYLTQTRSKLVTVSMLLTRISQAQGVG